MRAFLGAALLFIVSVALPPPWHFYLWGVSLLISVGLPAEMMTLGGGAGIEQEINYMLDVSPSAVKRFGLFNIIVLGEVVVGVVQGLAGHHELTWQVGVIALMLAPLFFATTAMSTDSHNPNVRQARQRPRAATEKRRSFDFPRAGIVEVGQKTGPSVSSCPRGFAWRGSTVWETARTCV